jgi:hypothetical protein
MPEVVAGNADGEITIAGFTTSDNCCVLKAVAESVTVTLNEKAVGEAKALGVPLITPAPLSDIPGGTAPPAKLQLNGAVPPLALSVRVHNVPAVHAWSGLVLIAGVGLIVRLKLKLPVSDAESVAVTLAGNVPEAVGVPAMPACGPAVGLTDRPPGRPAEVHV